MIAHLKGIVDRKTATQLIIDVNGVGYAVSVMPRMISNIHIGQEIKILIYSHITETAFDLYGFVNEQELLFFKQLLTISGVGPKSALHVMELGSVGEICGAIANGDTGYLTKVSGIGRKTAERMIVELRSKVGIFGTSENGGNVVGDQLGLVIDALIAMGYSAIDSRDVVKGMNIVNRSAEELVREALKKIHEKNSG